MSLGILYCESFTGRNILRFLYKGNNTITNYKKWEAVRVRGLMVIVLGSE